MCMALRFYLAGEGVALVDCATDVFARFGFMAGATCAVILLIAAVSFRSAFIPIRSVLALFITLCIVYGVSVGVFQYGWLDWLVPEWRGHRGLCQ